MTGSIVSIVIGLLTPFVLEWLKREPWVPILQLHGGWINAVLAAAVAVGQVVGVSFAFDEAAHTLTVSGLDWLSVATLGATFGLTWLGQQLVYVRVVRP